MAKSKSDVSRPSQRRTSRIAVGAMHHLGDERMKMFRIASSWTSKSRPRGRSPSPGSEMPIRAF